MAETCATEGCDKLRLAKQELCSEHYRQWYIAEMNARGEAGHLKFHGKPDVP
jgi:hypothetical protein